MEVKFCRKVSGINASNERSLRDKGQDGETKAWKIRKGDCGNTGR
jgi:hypothetical protein